MKVLSPNISGLIAIFFWASSALIVVNTGDIPPMLLTALAAFIGFLFCVLYWIAKGQAISKKFEMSKRAYALGIFGITGYITLWLAGLKLAPAFEANTLNYMWPLLLVVFSARVDRTKITSFQLIGLCFGLVGSFFIFQRYGFSQEYSAQNMLGLLLAFGGAVIWAIYSSLTKIVHFESDRVGIFLLITSIFAAILSVAFEDHAMINVHDLSVLAIVLLGATRVSFVFWDNAMKHGDRALLGSLSYLVPVFSVLLLAIFTNVSWSWSNSLGAGLIVCGCLISNHQKLSDLIKNLNTKN